MCFGVGQLLSGAVSQVGDSSKQAGDYSTVGGDLPKHVPVNPTSGGYICVTLNSPSVLLAILLRPCPA